MMSFRFPIMRFLLQFALVLACVLAVLHVAHAGGPPAPASRDYVVKPGDTCMAIVIRELGDRNQLDAMHALNPQLGPLPHKLTPGQVLKLPVAGAPQPDAHVTSQHGTVEVRKAGEESWIQSILGGDLFREWRVGARDKASAQVTFADQSSIAMRENTVVVIYGRSKGDSQVTGYGATLERGALRSRLADLDGHLEVTTPGGTVALRTGTTVLEVDESKKTLVSNHKGWPATLTSNVGGKPQRVAVEPGYGSLAAVGAAPAKPRLLPPSPVWQTVSHLAVGWAGHGGVVTGTWAAVAQAAKYRIEIAHDKALTKVELRLELPAAVTSFEARDVPAGDYVVAIAAVDSDGLESAPGVPEPVHVAEVKVPAGAKGDAVPTVALGEVLAMPDGVQCTMGGAAVEADHIVVAQPGTTHVACVGAGKTSASIDVTAAAVKLTTAAPPTSIEGSLATVDVALEADVYPVGTVVGRSADPALTVEGVTPIAGGVRVTFFSPTDAAPGKHELTLLLAQPTSALDIALGTIAIDVRARPPELAVAVGPAASGPPGPPVRPLRLALLGGGVIEGLSGSHSDRLGGLVDLDIIPGVRDRVLLSAELGGWHATYHKSIGTVELGVSAELPMRVTPILRLGLAAEVASYLRTGGYASLGVAAHLTPRISLLVLADGLLVEDAHQIQIGGGVQIRLP